MHLRTSAWLAISGLAFLSVAAIIAMTTRSASPDVPEPHSAVGWSLGAANTGLAPHGLQCASLPVYTGSEKPAAGSVISQKRITRPLFLSEGNITIEKSCVQPTTTYQGLPLLGTTDYNSFKDDGSADIAPTTVTIRDSEVDGSLLSDYLAAWSTGFIGVANLERNYIHDVGSGIGLTMTGDKLSSIIEGNYVTRLRAWGDPGTTGNHSDGFTIRDFTAAPGRQMIVRNNRFNCSSGSDTGAFFIQASSGNISNVTAEGNLLEGKGYQLALETRPGYTYSNMRLKNNRFSGTGWGAGYVDGGPGWTEQSDNYINDPTKPDNQGNPVTL
jgi:hypothetical protein